MLARACLVLALITAIPVWSQVDSTTADSDNTTTNNSEMQTPPPVSVQSFPTRTGDEMQSNYLNIGLVTQIAYNDNVLPGSVSTPVSDMTYSLWPKAALDRTSLHFHELLTYSPGFTFYDPTSSLNATDQSAAVEFRYNPSPHAAIRLGDSFEKSSSIFNQANPLSGAISGAAPVQTLGIYAPYANQLDNSGTVEITGQFSPTVMVGASGVATMLDFPQASQVPGLYNSNTYSGSGFYNQRLSTRQYTGVNYEYTKALVYPPNASSVTQTQTVSPFYTVYLNPAFSISGSVGAEHYQFVQSATPSTAAWTPAITASVGYQASHTSFAASFSKTVTGGGGLLGAFRSVSGNAASRWQMTRGWSLGLSASYVDNKSISPPLVTAYEPEFVSGGHTLDGIATVDHSFTKEFSLEFGYERLHESYSGVAVIDKSPDSDREYVSITYQLTRPMGR